MTPPRAYSDARNHHESEHDVGRCRELCCDDERCPCEGRWLAERLWIVSASDLDRIEGKRSRRMERAGEPTRLDPNAIYEFLAAYKQHHAAAWPVCRCDYCMGRAQRPPPPPAPGPEKPPRPPLHRPVS